MKRKTAKLRGSKWYSGAPCSRCGNHKRLVSNKGCYECARARTRTYQRRKWATDAGYRAHVSAANHENVRRYRTSAEFRSRESRRSAEAQRLKRLRDPVWAAKCSLASAAWVKANRGWVNAYQRLRKVLEQNSRCHCCSDAAIRAWYIRGATRGEHVDHRKALKLGGRHCCKNFQLLTPRAHQSKTSRDLRLIAAARRK